MTNLVLDPFDLLSKRQYYSIKLLLQGQKINPNQRQTSNEDTPLHYILKNKLEIKFLKLFLSNEADPNLQNKGNTTLHTALIRRCTDEIISLLLEYKASVNIPNKMEKLPLHFLPESRTGVELSNKMIAQVEDINKVDSKNSTILSKAAVYHSHPKIVQKLLEMGADVNISNHILNSPLHYIVKYNLFYQKTKENFQSFQQDKLTKQNGSMNENIQNINLLIKYGAKLNLQNINGDTPLHYLCIWNLDEEILKIFLENGANPNILNSFKRAPLHLLCRHGIKFKNSNLSSLVDIFLESNIQLQVKDNAGNSPLHIACKFGCSADVIYSLLKAGSKINETNNFNQTPLHLVCSNKLLNSTNYEVAKLLIDNKADVEKIDNSKMTALHYACYYGMGVDIIKILVINKPELLKKNSPKGIPYLIARKRKNTKEAGCIHDLMNHFKRIKKNIKNDLKKSSSSNLMNLESDLNQDKKFMKFLSKIKFPAPKILYSKLSNMELYADGFLKTIYRAVWQQTIVAVYRYLIPNNFDEERLKMIIENIRKLDLLRHPQSLYLYGACLEYPNFCIVTEFCENGNLRYLLNSQKTLSYKEKIDLIYNIAILIQVHHKQNIVHLSLSTANILLNQYNKPLLSEFGVFKNPNENLLQRGDLGSRLYHCAPEVFKNGIFSKASNIYNFSIIVWEIMTEKVPFSSLEKWEIKIGVVRDGKRPDLPTENTSLNFLIEKCWKQNPEERPTIEDVIKDLEELKKQLLYN
ncbi:ankyrin repeat-containing protein [Anaeramoeba flamelloides]|uniref:Ankyrin repeat-containing protein n=1 Tax=Anaeramoeba flamelloides TaxID=1746091 RepID=A0AAV7Z5J7_9EUKA|nr:ankyrin repeat-containing protein [Anaeramoeba flamelloides]KAJ6251648.1 ankyrin repeat-containing protein [Anaeramoeba flamelloides]